MGIHSISVRSNDGPYAIGAQRGVRRMVTQPPEALNVLQTALSLWHKIIRPGANGKTLLVSRGSCMRCPIRDRRCLRTVWRVWSHHLGLYGPSCARTEACP